MVVMNFKNGKENKFLLSECGLLDRRNFLDL